jgi:hypothetical protein
MRVGGILWGRHPPQANGSPWSPRPEGAERPKPPPIQKVFDRKWYEIYHAESPGLENIYGEM